MVIHLIISLLIVTTSCFTSTTDLGSAGEYSAEATLSETSTDVYSFELKFTFPSTILDDRGHIGLLWIETGQTDYTLTADNSLLDAFGYFVSWRNPCNSISDAYWGGYYSGTASFTSSSGIFSTLSTFGYHSNLVKTNTTDVSTDPSAPTLTFHYADIDTTSLVSVFKLPNMNQSFYYKCYSDFNRGSTISGLRTADVATAFSSTSTSTITDSYLGVDLSDPSDPSVPSSGSSSSGSTSGDAAR